MNKYYNKKDIDSLWELLEKNHPEIKEAKTIHDILQKELQSKNINPPIYVTKLAELSSYLFNVKELAAIYSSSKDSFKEEIKDFEASAFLKEEEGTIPIKEAKVREKAVLFRKDEAICKLISKRLDALCSSIESFTTTSQSLLKWKEKEYPTRQ